MTLTLARSGNAVRLLAAAPLLEALPPEAVEWISARVDWLLLPSGHCLFSRGDPADGLYIVLSGKLAVSTQSGGLPPLVRHVGSGDTVCDLAVLTGQPRSATVRAVRDSELVRLAGDVLQWLLDEHPATLRVLARGLAGLLTEPTDPAASGAEVSSVAVVAGSPGVRVGEFSSRLTQQLSRFGPTVRITAATVEAALGGSRRETQDSGEYGGLTRWLDGQEAAHRSVVYEADADRAVWTERCLRQADRVVVLASSRDSLSWLDRLRASLDQLDSSIDLVLLHEERRQPAETGRWISSQAFTRHHHATSDSDRDVTRVARHLAGRSVGLVLGGGGVRAYAHIGVLRALTEASIPIDRIGGAVNARTPGR